MKRTLAVVVLAALVCTSVQAQTVNPHIGTAEIPPWFFATLRSPRLTIADMKDQLRNLITAQEKYFNDHGTYTTDGSALGIYPVKSLQPTVQVIFAGSRGWTGMATDRSLKGKSCVVYIGVEKELPGGVPKTMATGNPAQSEAVPMCDEP
jgi:hypothetical protein